MREILFRAFVKDKNKIFDVKKIDFDYRIVWFEEENKPTDTMRMFDQIELMQFTGLTDKNGKKIFEGDIIKIVTETDDEEYPFVAEFFEIMFDDEKHRFVKRSDLGIDDFDYSKDEVNEYEIEVVGNVYENEELIDGRKVL